MASGSADRVEKEGEERATKSSTQQQQRWDACYDLALRRLVYSSAAGVFAGLLLFRSPVTRWATIAFAAGAGLGSAYTDCSHILEEKISTLTDVPETSASS